MIINVLHRNYFKNQQEKLLQQKEKEIEDRKDKRTKIQATQQSQMIDQRKNDLLPTDFESQADAGVVDFGLNAPM